MINYFIEYRKYFVVLAGFLTQLSFGSFYSFGNIQNDIISYMNKSSQSKGFVRTSNIAWTFALLAFGLNSSISFGGFLQKKIGPSWVVRIAGFIFSLNVCLAYFTLNSYWQVFSVTYGFFGGIGSGMAYAVGFGTACNWFKTQKGLVIGIINSAFSLSGSVFDYVQQCIMHHDNNLLPLSFLVLGICYGILQLIGSFLIKENPEIQELSTSTSWQNDCSQTVNLFDDLNSDVEDQTEFKSHDLFFEYDFWILWITLLLNCTSLLIFVSQVNPFANNHYIALGKNQLHKLSIISGISNFLGKLIWGYIIDRKPYKVVMLILTLTSFVFLGTLNALPLINNNDVSFYLYGVWICIIYFFISGSFSVFPTMCGRLFGWKNIICNYGVLFTSCYMFTSNQFIFINLILLRGMLGKFVESEAMNILTSFNLSERSTIKEIRLLMVRRIPAGTCTLPPYFLFKIEEHDNLTNYNAVYMFGATNSVGALLFCIVTTANWNAANHSSNEPAIFIPLFVASCLQLFAAGLTVIFRGRSLIRHQ